MRGRRKGSFGRAWNIHADLVILDVQMPHLNGLQVLEAMHADDRLRAVPVLMYSAGQENAQRDRALRLGAKAFLVKGGDRGA